MSWETDDEGEISDITVEDLDVDVVEDEVKDIDDDVFEEGSEDADSAEVEFMDADPTSSSLISFFKILIAIRILKKSMLSW